MECHKEHSHQNKTDLLFISCILLIIPLYLLHLTYYGETDIIPKWLLLMSGTVHEMVNKTWVGVLIGVLMVSIINNIPKDVVLAALGNKKGFSRILRATIAGVALDICSHGILLVAAKLYERGVSTGQVMAFLIASPFFHYNGTMLRGLIAHSS